MVQSNCSRFQNHFSEANDSEESVIFATRFSALRKWNFQWWWSSSLIIINTTITIMIMIIVLIAGTITFDKPESFRTSARSWRPSQPRFLWKFRCATGCPLNFFRKKNERWISLAIFYKICIKLHWIASICIFMNVHSWSQLCNCKYVKVPYFYTKVAPRSWCFNCTKELMDDLPEEAKLKVPVEVKDLETALQHLGPRNKQQPPKKDTERMYKQLNYLNGCWKLNWAKKQVEKMARNDGWVSKQRCCECPYLPLLEGERCVGLVGRPDLEKLLRKRVTEDCLDVERCAEPAGIQILEHTTPATWPFYEENTLKNSQLHTNLKGWSSWVSKMSHQAALYPLFAQAHVQAACVVSTTGRFCGLISRAGLVPWTFDKKSPCNIL